MVSVVVLVAVVVTTVVAVVVVAAAVVTRKRKSVLIANTLVGIIMRQGSTPRTYSSKHAQIQEKGNWEQLIMDASMQEVQIWAEGSSCLGHCCS